MKWIGINDRKWMEKINWIYDTLILPNSVDDFENVESKLYLV